MNRDVEFVDEAVYHVFTRGVEKRHIFSRDIDYKRFLLVAYLVNDASPGQLHIERLFKGDDVLSRTLSNEKDDREKLVEILSWCLMPNHVHFLLKQLRENGISIFMQRLLTSHAKYYNIVYERVGALFGGRFKAVHIATDEQYTHASRYIHLNPLGIFDPAWKERGHVEDKDGAEKFLMGYKWSSLPEYLGVRQEFAPLIDRVPVMEYFENNINDYWKFLMEWTKSDLIQYGE